MSPELINIMTGSNNKSIGEFNPEKCDIFSLGITFLKLIPEIFKILFLLFIYLLIFLYFILIHQNQIILFLIYFKFNINFDFFYKNVFYLI